MTDHTAALMTYLADRDAERADRARDFLASLTDRERGLIHDAAVMGYVQGLMRDREEGCPKDSQTVALVIDACFAFPDLYPTVNAEVEDHRQTVEYLVQSQQPDGTWEQSSSTSTDPEFIVERLAARRRMHPDFERRIVRRTTTVVIEVAAGGTP